MPKDEAARQPMRRLIDERFPTGDPATKVSPLRQPLVSVLLPDELAKQRASDSDFM